MSKHLVRLQHLGVRGYISYVSRDTLHAVASWAAALIGISYQGDRTSWIYCPVCRHDLNGDNESFVSMPDEVATFSCAACSHVSRWLMAAPVPLLLRGGER